MSSSAYSPIKHLAHALFFRHNEAERYMAMLTGYTAYFDASGQRGQGDLLVVGGYVASVKRWDSFDDHWANILRARNVKEFHMTDFMHEEVIDGAWKKDDGRAENFLKKLVNAICNTAEYAPTVMIYLSDWEELNKKYQLRESWHTPLALAGGSCIQLIYDWCERKRIQREHIEFFFEDGDLDRGDLQKLVKKAFGFELMMKKKSLRPLQACDLLAWEAQNAEKHLIRHPGDEDFDISDRLKQMMSRIDHEPLVYEPIELENFCKKQNIPIR